MSTPSKTTAPSATRWRSRPAADSRPSPDATVASLRRGRQRSVATIPCVNRTPERHDSVTTDPRERRDSRIPVLMRDSGWSRPSAAAAIATHRSGKTAAGAPQIGICRSQRPIYGTAARIAADRSAQGLREAAVGRTASSGPSEATSPARRKPPVRPVGSHQSGPSEATSPARRKPPVRPVGSHQCYARPRVYHTTSAGAPAAGRAAISSAVWECCAPPLWRIARRRDGCQFRGLLVRQSSSSTSCPCKLTAALGAEPQHGARPSMKVVTHPATTARRSPPEKARSGSPA
jgi:hypothetical protein